MKKILLLALFGAFLLSCNDGVEKETEINKKEKKWNRADYENEKAEIIALEDTLIQMGANPDAKSYSQKLLLKTVEFADNYPKDEQSPYFLFMASRAANGLGQYTNSIDIINRIILNYTNYDRLVEVYFMKAFTYDEDLNQKAEAKKVYVEIMEKFPNDPLAKEAKILLENLYLSDEEIIKKYQSGN
jgi:hypothetical protein